MPFISNLFWLLQYILVDNSRAFFLVFDSLSHLIAERKMCQEKHAVVAACQTTLKVHPSFLELALIDITRLLAKLKKLEVKPFVTSQRVSDPHPG